MDGESNNDNLLVPKFLEKALENVSEEPSKAIGDTLRDIWYLVLGGRVGKAAEKRRIKDAMELEEFKELIQEKRNKIPEDKLIIPDTQKVAAILDAARYCIDKKELREMFAGLLNASMNKDTERYVHISFAQILRQLVPDEVKILLELPKKSLFEPLVDISVKKPEIKGCFTLFSNVGVLGAEGGCEFPDELPLYIDNMIRLGLVSVPSGEYLADAWRYDKILNSLCFQEKRDIAVKSGEVIVTHKMIGVTELGDTLRNLCIQK